MRAPTDPEWDAAIEARLQACVPEFVHGGAVQSVTPWAEDVWLVRLADGGCLIAKHQIYGLLTRGEPWDLLEVECRALRCLRAAGCPVPLVFGVDPGAQLILLEFAGRSTVDDLLSTRNPAPPRILRRLLRGLVRIEDTLASTRDLWTPRVAPGAGVDDLAASWAGVADAAVAGLTALWRRLGRGEAPVALRGAIHDLSDTLGRRPPDLGPTDYRAANVVVDDVAERLAFLELAKLGWDWTERRAVQYTSATDGSGTTLLSAQVLEGIDGNGGGVDAGALDGHHLLFQLLLAQRLWGRDDVDGVRAGPGLGFLRSLTTPLSDDSRVGGLRQTLRALPSSRESLS